METSKLHELSHCMSSFWNKAPLAAAAITLLFMGGCADPGATTATSRPMTAADAGLDVKTAAWTGPQAQWWRDFGNMQLDGLIDAALQRNPNLQAASARLARATADAAAAGAQLLPQAGASASVTRERYSANGLYPAPLAGNVWNTGDLTLSGSWELDFFGRNAAALDASLGIERATQADVAAARVLLAAQVANAYVQLAQAMDERDVLARTLEQRERLYKLIGDRVAAGLDTQVELRQGEGALPDTRMQIEAVNARIAGWRHALADLTAQPLAATESVAPHLRDLNLEPLPAAGLTADLLGQRADIAAARERAGASLAHVREARAAFYPSVNLTAFIGLSALGLDNLLQGDSRQLGVSPAIHLPIFEGGRLRAGLQGASADSDAAIDSYNQTVLSAVHDVADQMTATASVKRQQIEQVQSARAAEAAYALAEQRYQGGLGTYLQVLSAETAVLTQRRNAVDLQAQALQARINLCRALGGGYRAADIPAPDASSQAGA